MGRQDQRRFRALNGARHLRRFFFLAHPAGQNPAPAKEQKEKPGWRSKSKRKKEVLLIICLASVLPILIQQRFSCIKLLLRAFGIGIAEIAVHAGCALVLEGLKILVQPYDKLMPRTC